MDAATPLTGIPIVVPAFLLSAGIAFYTGVQSALIGFVGTRVTLYLLFSVVCVGAAGSLLSFAAFHSAASVAAAAEALRWQAASILFVLPAFVAFVASLTGERRVRPWPAVTALGCAVLLVANFVLPYGVRFSSMEPAAPMRMPWGEVLPRFIVTISAWNIAFVALALAVLGWAAHRSVILWRSGERRTAGFLVAYLLIQVATVAWGALIDSGRVDSIHLGGFAFLALVVMMSVGLALDARDRRLELEKVNADLLREAYLRKGAEAHILRTAYHDELTGLGNRAQMRERLEQTVSSSEGHLPGHRAIVLMDLDNFRTVNSALSHGVGDDVLKEVGQRLKHVASGRAYAARLGGDEFAAFTTHPAASADVAAREGLEFATAMERALAEPMRIGDHVLHIGASIGVATLNADSGTPEDALHHAAMALWIAKGRGRNHIQIFDTGMQAVAERQLQVERGLRAAIGRAEFSLHYQPQLDAAGRTIGAEALLRWNSRELGPVSPAELLPVAERTGLIHAIGDWVLDQACRSLAKWARDGVPFDGVVAVNVSPWQFTRPDFVDRVSGAVAQHGIDPRRITLEILESALLQDLRESIGKLEALRAKGFSISLDDFGTGYSSLAYLQTLPLDEFKIDRMFVAPLDENAGALVRSMITVGRHLELGIVAEGVETAVQRDRLLEMGCERFQGYLFCRPLPEPEWLAWLALGKTVPTRETCEDRG